MNDGGTTDASFALCIYALYRESTCISFIENDGENSMELANPTFESRIYTIVLFDKETLQSTLSVYLPLTPKEETADKFEPFYEVDKGNLSKGYLRNFWPKPKEK